MPTEDSLHSVSVSGQAVVRVAEPSILYKAMETILSASPDPVFLVDRQGHYLRVGEAGARLFGRPASEIVGKTAADLGLAAEVAADLAAQTDRVFQSKQPHTGTTLIPTISGPRLYEHQFSPLLDDQGEVMALLWMARDITDLTERRQQEAEIATLNRDLQRRLHEIETIFLTVPTALCIAEDTACTRIRGNPASYRALRLPDGANISKTAPPDEVPPFRVYRDGQEIPDEDLPMQVAARTGQTVSNVEYDIVFEDGVTISRYGEAAPLFDEQGHPRGSVGAFIDITERKQTEEKLKESEASFRAVFDNTAVGVALVTADGRVLQSNPALRRMLGYSEPELAEMSYPEFTYIDDLENDKALHQEVLDGKRDVYTLEKRYLRKDGSLLWAHLSIGAVRNADGSLRFMVAVVNDIAASKAAEEEVRRSYQELFYHFENTPLAVIEWDEQFCVRHWSAGAERVFGWTAAEIEGKHFDDWEFVYDEDREAAREVAVRLQNGTEARNVHYNRNYTKSGQVVDCEWYNSVLRGADGTWLSMLSLVLDVTDRKRTEAQLIQAHKMESIGRLAGGIAHDYNNLLAIILGYTEAIEDGLAPDSELLPNLRNIQGAANRAATLTRQLLGFARRQASQLQIVSPNALLQVFMGLLKPLLTADVELVLLPGEMMGNVEMDPTHLEQIVMNLAVNARDAMPQGGKLILKTQNLTITEPRLTERVVVRPGEYVWLSVIDTGDGMTEEVRRHLFEPFFSTKQQGGGTGLGLATVYGLVKQAGGYIWVDSDVGVGTTFHIYLPRVDAVPVAQVAAEASVASGGTETVLVVDDEPLVQELTVGTLRQAGYNVLVAENGAEALRVFESHPDLISLVVTDAIMPVMGGRELAERLGLVRPDVRVLVVSGYSEEGYAAQSALPAGVEFLQKPFTAHALLEKVRQLLNA